ncbi:MAG: histidine kinase [Clostridia bacterium]|nr:histidine kinase [Clostridia bacterium]
MDKPSFFRKIFALFFSMVILLSFLLGAYLFTFYEVTAREERQEGVKQTEIHGLEIQKALEQMDGSLRDLLLQQFANLQLLKSPEETERFYAGQSVFRALREALANNKTRAECFVAADSAYDTCLDYSVSGLNYWDRDALRQFTRSLAQTITADQKWGHSNLNGQEYIYRAYLFEGRAVAAYYRAEQLLAAIPQSETDQVFVLSDSSGTMLASTRQQAAAPGDMPDMTKNKALISIRSLLGGELALSCLATPWSLWTLLRSNMTAVLLIIVVALSVSLLLARYMRRELYTPMRKISEVMSRIKRQEYDVRITDHFGTREFEQLKDSFNQLMDEIVDLKINRYEQIIALQDMELKSIRLQLRPHFFLNAITTISSLDRQNRSNEISAYVDALSKNIRYMFRSGLHTVPVREEILHIENYFSMQECVYPGCIFHLTDLPSELADWPIPQMLIQTIIENEYKYAVSMEDVLTILIRVSKCEKDGEEMLKITIEDDGKGYPEEVLAAINSPDAQPGADGHRVGLWSVRRTMELMYERKDLTRFSNITPHGCLNTIYVPRKPLHEYNVQTKEKE